LDRFFIKSCATKIVDYIFDTGESWLQMRAVLFTQLIDTID